MKNLLPILLLAALLHACHKPEIVLPDPPVENVEFFETCLYRPGDYGSANWRIPALCCLSDGTLISVCDKRKYNESDLPEDIDLVVRRSTDNGHTWSQPFTLAQGTGRKQGFGDAALVECANGDVVCVFVGGNGLFQSSPSDPIRSYVCRSSDRGQTWSQPEEITDQLWGENAIRPACRTYRASFFGSGNGLRLTRGTHAGRILFAAAMRRHNSDVLDNFVVYSDDHGHTWQVSQRAYEGGDEAKLVELTDGRVLLSVRQNGARGYNISTNGGLAWGTQGRWDCLTANACNGDLLRLAATDRGDSLNILLHSLPNSMQRRNVSIFVSYDEGLTWQDPVLLFDGPSVYSSLTLLKNGGVGVLLEKNPDGACEIWFQCWPPKQLLQP